MQRYFFGITDGRTFIREREGMELESLAEVQREAIDFALKVLRHRFVYGIDDAAVCKVVVSNQIGRVLTKIPLADVKRRRRLRAA